jgi:hypothetical protein
MNYSEFFGEGEDYWSHVPNFCGQNIIFLTSTDLLHWTKVDESFRFNADGRWYKEKGRWDSMDVLPRPDGSLYAYFTAEPVPEKLDYKACYAVGFAESKDGLHWQALPPLPGETAGEVGGGFVRFLEPALTLDAASVMEASLTLPETDTPMGFYLDSGDGTGQVVLFTRQGTQFGTAKLDGSAMSTGAVLTRDLDFAGEVNVRLVLKKDMIETYMNDYLMNTKRVKCTGRIGVIGQTGGNYLENIKVWTQL